MRINELELEYVGVKTVNPEMCLLLDSNIYPCRSI